MIMNRSQIFLVASILAVLIQTRHHGDAAQLPESRLKRGIGNLPEDVVRTMKEIESLQDDCNRGEFFSKSTYQCESCDLSTNYGTNMGYNHLCRTYYDEQRLDRLNGELNKTPWGWMGATFAVTIAITAMVLAIILPKTINYYIRQNRAPTQVQENEGERAPLRDEDRPNRVIVEPPAVIQEDEAN